MIRPAGNSSRSTWNFITFEEHPYDVKLLMDYSRHHLAKPLS